MPKGKFALPSLVMVPSASLAKLVRLKPIIAKQPTKRQLADGGQSGEIVTNAEFPFSKDPRVVAIPPNNYFRWAYTQGTWIWNPALGACGPEGQPPPATDFFVPQFNGGTLTLARDGGFAGYSVDVDASRGGKYVFLNDSNQDRLYAFFCNDAARVDAYKDNSGSIRHMIEWWPKKN